MTNDNREPIRSDLTGFWLYIWELHLTALLEQVRLMQFCERNAERRREICDF